MKRATRNNERFVVGRRGQPSVVIMSVRDYMRTFAPAPGESRAMQAAAKRTGAATLTAGQVHRIVATVCRERKPQSTKLTSGPIFLDARLIDEQVHGREREHLPISRLEEPTHIFASHFEATAGNAGNHIIPVARLIPKGAQALNTRHLVSCRAVILSEPRLDQCDRTEFVRNDKVRGLIKSGDPLRSFRFSKTDLSGREYILDCTLDHLAHKLADRIPVRGERSPQEPFVEKHGIRDAEIGDRLKASYPFFRIRLIETMQDGWNFSVRSGKERLHPGVDHHPDALIG
jgi:hypothetical protein